MGYPINEYISIFYSTLKVDSIKLKSFLNINHNAWISINFVYRFIPVFLIRLSNLFFKLRLLPISYFIKFINLFLFKIDVPVYATIGHGLILPHPFCIVIGSNSIGNNCILYQGVVIGAKSIEQHSSDLLRRPVIGDSVIIYSGAKVIGDIIVESDCKIGANVVLDCSTRKNTRVKIDRLSYNFEVDD